MLNKNIEHCSSELKQLFFFVKSLECLNCNSTRKNVKIPFANSTCKYSTRKNYT